MFIKVIVFSLDTPPGKIALYFLSFSAVQSVERATFLPISKGKKNCIMIMEIRGI
jgi:hypothetical protein